MLSFVGRVEALRGPTLLEVLGLAKLDSTYEITAEPTAAT